MALLLGLVTGLALVTGLGLRPLVRLGPLDLPLCRRLRLGLLWVVMLMR